MTAQSVKGRHLVPTRHLVTGDVDFIDNVVAFRTLRGEFVSRGREVMLPDGRIRTELVLLDRKVRLLARARRRVLMVVWPTGEGKLVRTLRVLGYAAGAVVTGFATYLLVKAIETIVVAVEFVVRHWQAFGVVFVLAMGALVVVSVRAGSGAASGAGDFVIRVCRTCLRPFH